MDTIAELIKELDSRDSPQHLEATISALARVGEPAVSALLNSVSPWPSDLHKRALVARILRRIGPPANHAAIRFLVGMASEINSPGWDDAFGAVLEIGQPSSPEIRRALSLYSQDAEHYSSAIQGLTTLLEQLGPVVIDTVLAELLSLFRKGSSQDLADEYVLGPLRIMTSYRGDVILPVLWEKIESTRSPRMKQAVFDALGTMDPKDLLTIAPGLERYLLDDSEKVRASARHLLAKIAALGKPTGQDQVPRVGDSGIPD